MTLKRQTVFVASSRKKKFNGFNVLIKENAEDRVGITFSAVVLVMFLQKNFKVWISSVVCAKEMSTNLQMATKESRKIDDLVFI